MFFLNMIQLNLFINKNIVNFILLLYKLMRCFMRKRLLIVFSVLLFLLCLSVVSATDENTNSSIVAQDYDGNEFYVDLGGDDSNSGQLNSPFNSINKAVEVSKSNDNVVIHLGEGTFEGNGNVMISINKAHLSQGGSITIVGAGADKTIIKGSSAYYAFNIYADSVVTLRDLSIVDCKSVEGGAICNSGTLLVDNCIFRNNFAFNTGGAISSIENGDCKIYNSVFINNSVICNDEYENANGGAVYSLKSDLLVDSCRFVGNFAKGNCLNAISGGAIYVGAYLNNVPSVKNSNFINNYVISTNFRTNWEYAKGGSIYMINCNLFNDSFINSSVTGSNGVGGSYYSEPKYLNSISNILRINSSVNGVLESNIYPADYDGKYSNEVVVYVSVNGNDEKGNGSFNNPYATIANAIAKSVGNVYNLKVYLLDGVYSGAGNTNISLPCSNIQIAGIGSKVIIDGSGSNWFAANERSISGFKYALSNLTLINFKAKSIGYKKENNIGVISNYADLTIDNCIFKNIIGSSISNYDLANLKVISSSFVDSKHLGFYGGVLFNYDANARFYNCIVNNYSSTDIFYSTAVNTENVYLEFFNSTFKNLKSFDSRCKFLGASNTNVTMSYVNYADNDCNFAVAYDKSFMKIDDCVFRNTTGHGISADKLFSTLIVNNTKFIESSGGVYSGTKALNVIVANTEFINCNLGVINNGRTVYLTGLIAISDIFSSTSSSPRYNVTQVLLDNVTFDGNYNGTKTVGSALYLSGTNTTVINSKFINLKDISAIHAFSSSGYKCNVTIIGTYFENNTRDIDYGYGQTNDYRPIFWLINSTFINSGAFACPDGRYQDAWWVVNNTKFINMTNQVLFRGSVSSPHKDDPLPDGVNNIITIINSLFLNNEKGVRFIGGNVTGSSFYNTVVTAVGSYGVYLDNNFWNSSEPTYVYSPSISCGSWIVPVLVADNASGPVQTIKLVYLAFNGTDYSYYDVSKVPIFDVNANLTVSNGVINPNKGIFNTDGLTANYTYNGVGNQTVTATLSDGNILKLNVTFYRIDTFTNMTISNNAPQTGDYITVNVVVRDKNGKLLNGSVNVYLNSVLKGTISLINGMGSFDVLAEKTGPCEIFVNYTGDLDNSYSSNMTIVSVKNTQMNVSVSDSDSASNVTFTVDFDHVANGFVFVTIGGVTYNATVLGKEAKVIVPPLAVGKYDAIVSYNGVVNKTVAVNISPDRNPVLNISDIVMIYKDGTRMVAVLTDYKGNPIANATVYFSINGVTYVRTTDVNGSASIGLNLGSGVYGASVYYNGSDMYDKVSKNITVTINPTVLADDLVKMYKNATKFSAKFTDSTGKALVNSDVRFNINGVFYTRTTDAYGVASLAINLRPGDYILTAYNPVNGEQKGVNITVKSLIVQNDLTKYYLNASRFQATIYNKDGSLAVNKNVTFNINGVFYIRTTDSNGVVSLAINLRPGDYIITTIFDGLDIGNKVTVLPTLVTKDLNMKYMDGSNFTAQTLDSQGKALANQTVSFNVNGVFYHRITNEDGIASLRIRLMAGEYIITSYWNNFQTGNTIKIY